MSAIKLKSADGYDVSLSATGATTGGAVSVQVPGIIKSGTATSASSTSVGFTGIPAWVKRITVLYYGLSTSGSSPPVVQFGAGSYETASYIGGGTSTGTGTAQTVTTQNETAGIRLVGAHDASYALNGRFVLELIGSNTWVGTNVCADDVGTRLYFGAGRRALSGTLDRIRLSTAGGTDTFDAGTINILYE